MSDRRSTIQLVAAAMTLAAALMPDAAAAQGSVSPHIAVLERVQADVRIERASANLKGAARQTLMKADLVRTGAGSRALVRFIDGSLLTLGELAEAILDDYAMHAHRRSGTMFIDIIKGAFRFRSGGMGAIPDKRIEIRTPVANLVLRDDAELWGGPIDDGHGIIVMSGVVEARNDAGSVVLSQARPGTMVTTLSNPPDRPQIWGRDKLGRANAMVSFK